MANAHKLTPLGVKNLKEAGLYGDGAGLSLKVTSHGSKSWIQRYMINGTASSAGLGAYPEVTLAEARERAAENRKKIRSGINPLVEKKAKAAIIQAEKAKSVVTFDQCASKYIDAFKNSWKNAKHAEQWRSTLMTYASPTIGALNVNLIDTSLIMEILNPIWQEIPETAGRLRGRIETVLDWSRVQGYRSGDNPARLKGHIEYLLPRRNKVATTVHHPALDYAQMALFLKALRMNISISASAVEFGILTGARSGEVRLATWSEIDDKTGMWIVPSSHMKSKREHRVPLSKQALVVIANMKVIYSGDLIFPGRKKETELSDMSLTAVLRRMDKELIKEGGKGWRNDEGRVITMHGFRSSFRDWVGEITEYPGEMADLALSHVVPNKVEAAYRRLSMVAKRRAMMQEWADYCCRSEATEAGVH